MRRSPLIALLLLLGCFDSAQAKRVLLLTSYHRGHEWNDEMVRGVQEGFQKSSARPELFIEHLDTLRHTASEYFDALHAFYKGKYGGATFDLILAADDASVRFLVKRRDDLFPDVPVVFCGVNDYNSLSDYITKNQKVQKSFAGVLERLNVAETVRAALALHPRTRFVYTIGETENVDYGGDLMGAFPGITARRISTSKLTLEQMERELSTLPERSIVLLSAFAGDVRHRQFSMAESARFVSEVSNAPVYGLTKSILGHGIVGGKLNDPYFQGFTAANIAAEVMGGASPASIGMRSVDVPYQFDHAQLKRWNLSARDLPSGSIVIGKPRSLYEEHKTAIWIAAISLMAQALAISLLIAGRIKSMRYQRALSASEERFRSAFSHAAVGISIAEADGRLLEANPAYYTLTGLSNEDIGRKVVNAPIHPEDAGHYATMIRKLTAGDSASFVIEARYRRRDEQMIWVRNSVSLLRTEPDGPTRLITLTEDITARKKAEEDLAEQVRDFETLLGVIPVGIAVAEDPECTRMRGNRALEEVLGVETGRDISKTTAAGASLPFRLLRDGREIPPDELPMQVAARKGIEVRGFEIDVIREDGRVVHQFGHVVPLLDEQGAVRGSIGVFVDMTERKRGEESLKASERRFRELADSMPQIVWTARPDGYLDYYNQRWYEMTGFSQGSGGDESWKPIVHPDDLQKTLDLWYHSVQSGEPYQIEYRIWDRKVGRYRWRLGRALPVRRADGAIVKWYGTSTDIDDHKRAEQDLLRANAALEQFAYSASHDLQEPLRNVSLYSQMIQRRYAGKLDAESDQFITFIVDGVHRMRALLQGLLAYTQMSHVEELPAAPVNSGSVLDNVLGSLRGMIEEMGARVTCEDLPAVMVHEFHLQQLLQNLISNALRYRGKEAPHIHITVRRLLEAWLFTVKDNGIGIDPQYHQRIFGIFKRLHTQDEYAGTGIGLAICQKIVERYGGRIWVESELGKGAAFFFTLPDAGEPTGLVAGQG